MGGISALWYALIFPLPLLLFSPAPSCRSPLNLGQSLILNEFRLTWSFLPFSISPTLFFPLLIATHDYQQHTSHHCQFPIGRAHTGLDPNWLLSHPDVLAAHWGLAEADVWLRDWWRTERGVLCFCGSVAVALRKICVPAVIPTVTHSSLDFTPSPSTISAKVPPDSCE